MRFVKRSEVVLLCDGPMNTQYVSITNWGMRQKGERWYLGVYGGSPYYELTEWPDMPHISGGEMEGDIVAFYNENTEVEVANA